ncbi:MAG: hypothetical protein ACK58T_15670, partial [Phycisphaerae bacterium]
SADSSAENAAASQAKTLLQQARLAMDAGQLDEAGTLAQQAAELDVTYGVFDDSPSLVLRDLESLEADSSGTTGQATAGAALNTEEIAAAKKLLKEAREALMQGRLSVAREKANKAKSMNVTWGMTDDRPELVLGDVDVALSGRGARKSASAESQPLASIESPEKSVASKTHAGGQKDSKPLDLTAEEAVRKPVRSDRRVSTISFDSESEFPVLRPDSESGDEAYRRGLELFRRGDRAGARQAFAAAWTKAGDLDQQKKRQLQEFMQDLSSEKVAEVQLVSASEETVADSEPAAEESEADQPVDLTGSDTAFSDAAAAQDVDPLTAATEESDVRYHRLRTEVMNSVFRAEKLKDENPDEALQILDNTLATVEAAPLTPEVIETLAGIVKRS